MVRLRGTGFLNSAELSCSFGATIVPAKWQSSFFVQCISPAKSPGTQVTVKASNNRADFSSTFTIFEYQGKTELTSAAALVLFLHHQQISCPFIQKPHVVKESEMASHFFDESADDV